MKSIIRCTRLVAVLSLFLVYVTAVFPVIAQNGGTVINGSTSAPPGIVIPGFLFEPEVPLNTLKSVPQWYELEQLLDNPYLVALCSALPVDPLIKTTPGTTQITGSPAATIYPAYCTTSDVKRRPGFGVTLPPLLTHPLNYNATTGEEMRMLNLNYPGGTWIVSDTLLQCSSAQATAHPAVGPLCASIGNNPNYWLWSYKFVNVTVGSSRIEGQGRAKENETDNNGPIRADVSAADAQAFAGAATSGTPTGLATATAILDKTCIATTELFPAPEGSITCGGDPGEPDGVNAGVPYIPTFGVLRGAAYSVPVVSKPSSFKNGVVSSVTPLRGSDTGGPITANLDHPRKGVVQPRNPGGAGGLKKPSLRVVDAGGSPSAPNYRKNTDPNNVTPSNENDYVQNRNLAAVLGKSLFWDMQVGSDAVQSCGTCHPHAGADNRVKNQLNPNHLGGDGFQGMSPYGFEVQPPNGTLVASDFPFQKLTDPEIPGDPQCSPARMATINPGVLENNFPGGGTVTVCDASNVVSGNKNISATYGVANDVASSMGVHFGRFFDIPTPGPAAFGPASTGGVRSVVPDLRSPVAADNIDPIPGFRGAGGYNDIRRVEPRNTPTIFAAALNFDNFWDGRANHDFNGGSVFGSSDPQSHVFVRGTDGNLVATRQIIRFVSLASLATGPGLSEFEMSFLGRNWAKIGKKLLQNGVTPLANQLVDPTDSILGAYSNQGGSACAGRPAADRSPSGVTPKTTLGSGVPGLCISYPALIRDAFYPALHSNTTQHLNGCYTDGRSDIHPNQCTGNSVPILTGAGTIDNSNIADPFDGYKLAIATGAASPADTNQFKQMEGNFSLFWGLSIQIWAELLMPDNTPFDQFMDENPDAFEAIGEVGEAGLVGPLPNCTDANPLQPQRHCFRALGNFQRDNDFSNATADPVYNANANNCNFPSSGEGSTTLTNIGNCKGNRVAGSTTATDPLLGMDIFQGSNLSLKNPNFRAARCGNCHAGAALTDNTMPFTMKAQLGDFIGEFLSGGNEALIEPLGRTRVISGFLLEDEMNANGQDAVERTIANQSIVPCPASGLAYPGGLDGGTGTGFGPCSGAAQAFFDNGVYNLGVTRCEAGQTGVSVTGYCDDNGRGNTDAFGWPLSHAAKLLKNLGGPGQLPGTPLPNFNPLLGTGGGLFNESPQDQSINPGDNPKPLSSMLPPYIAPFMQDIVHGDAQPELDEVFAGLNTTTDTAMLEGFIDVLGPFNVAGVLNESMNNGAGPLMGTWPVVNRVGRFGSMKAPQLREVELTGPYFHNGGKLTLRQVVDFYVRGGDFPVTNAQHRDFNMINQNIEVQSNLTEAEKVSLVDFLLELTDDRVRYEKAPFDHPQVIQPLDGTAPEPSSIFGRDAMLTTCSPFNAPKLGGDPGRQTCDGGMFLNVPAVGAFGNLTGPLGNFLGIAGRDPVSGLPAKRLSGSAANCESEADSQYCH